MSAEPASSKPRFWSSLGGIAAGILLTAVFAAAGVGLLFAAGDVSHGAAGDGKPLAYADEGGLSGQDEPAPALSMTPSWMTPTPTAAAQATLRSLPASATPFQPVTNTPRPTATATSTPTFTPTAAPTETPAPPPTEAPPPAEPPPPPEPPPALPEDAAVGGVRGIPQTLTLSCESRSASDWAHFFGVEIDELTFQYGLPSSDNPNTGFVGNPNGPVGRIPPYDYGVHAPPVAAQLRAYGLRAASRYGMSWDELRAEIAAGRPVIVWVIAGVWTGSGVSYTAPDGETLTVAYGEHTVIVNGYSPYSVSVVDGGMRYSVPVERFLASWGVLGNMAVTAGE